MALQLSNNAICTLQNPILEDSTVIFLAGNYDRLPTQNFIVEVATFGTDNETVIARENILIASRNGNQLIVGQRAYEPVPIDDNASENIQQPLAFEVGGTVVKQVVSKALFDEIDTRITDINEDITDINNALTDDYVSNEDLEALMGQPGGIATLDENSKIPGNQINTSTLQVENSIIEMTAGENITIGTAVTAGIEKYLTHTERSDEYNLPPYSGSTVHFVDFVTFNVTSALKYIKITFTQTYPGTGYSNICQIQVLQNGTVLQTSDSFTIENNKDTIVEILVTVPNLTGEIQLKIGTTSSVYTYRTKYKELILYTVSNKVYKYNPSELVTEYSGIAVETKNAGENIRIATDGNITTYSGLIPGAEYYINDAGTIEQFVGTSTLPIDTKVIAGIALSENILNINKCNPKLEVVNVTVNGASTSTPVTLTVNHNLQTTPKNILIWYCYYNASATIKNLSDTQGMFQYNKNTGFVGLGVTEKNEKFITITNNNTASFNLSILLIA